jgi:DNA-binding XRE family transcriptional regulator
VFSGRGADRVGTPSTTRRRERPVACSSVLTDPISVRWRDHALDKARQLNFARHNVESALLDGHRKRRRNKGRRRGRSSGDRLRAPGADSPVGSSAVEAAQGRAKRSSAYRDTRAEYECIRALREVSPIAAHLRERRFELGLTQEDVAKAADTSHRAVFRHGKGTHIPQLPTLQRIAAVLDEELLVCFQRTVDGEVEREFAAVHDTIIVSTGST